MPARSEITVEVWACSYSPGDEAATIVNDMIADAAEKQSSTPRNTLDRPEFNHDAQDIAPAGRRDRGEVRAAPLDSIR